MANKRAYLRRCIDLMNISIIPGHAALIVHNDVILAEGAPFNFANPSRENIDIDSFSSEKSKLLPFSTLYISFAFFEHFEEKSIWVNYVIKHRIPRVILSFPKAIEFRFKKEISQLTATGVKVEIDLLSEEEIPWFEDLKINKGKNRPKIILKYAKSADHFIGKEKESVWLTNPFSKRLVHKWRSEIDAILIGTNTAIVDNPKLTTRYDFGKSPYRVVLDRKGRLTGQENVFDGKNRTLIVTERKNLSSKQRNTTNLNFFTLPFDIDFLPNLLGFLNQEEACKSILVEGGAKLLNSFVEAGLWDEARVFISPVRLGNGILAPNLEVNKLEQRLKILNDELLIYKNRFAIGH